MMIRGVTAFCLVSFLFVLFCLTAKSQVETATLSRRITDPQGGSVPKAQVQIGTPTKIPPA